MPPKKRSSTVANTDAAEPSSKRTRKPIPETAATSRPKRLSFEKLPPRAAKTKTTAPAAKPKTARATAASNVPDTPKKRGRPSLQGTTPAKAAKAPKLPKKVAAVGRPKVSTIKTTAAGKLAKRRGRPPKSSLPSSSETIITKKRKRTVGRPSLASKALPKKSIGKLVVKKQPVTRGPRKPAYLKEKDPDLTIEVAEDDAYGPDGKSYWLLKAEPESRLVKGVDVKFSIDDLRAATEPEPWDGVRNPVARNNLRAMKKGDYAFFYHSSCKVPGIVGEMEIVKEHSVDESAFDPAHPYYDEKSSRENPKWEVVHVEFRRKFDRPLTLETLKSHALPGLPLDNMQTIRQSRVSVSRVTPAEWEFIKSLIEKQIKADAKAEAKAKAKADAQTKAADEAKTDADDKKETENSEPAPASEPIPESSSAAPAAVADPVPEPAPTPAAGIEKQTTEDADKPTENGVTGDKMDVDGKPTENGVNGQTTTERIASVMGAFLTN